MPRSRHSHSIVVLCEFRHGPTTSLLLIYVYISPGNGGGLVDPCHSHSVAGYHPPVCSALRRRCRHTCSLGALACARTVRPATLVAFLLLGSEVRATDVCKSCQVSLKGTDAFGGAVLRVEALRPKVQGMKRKADEPDPELQTYGPAMKAKVLALLHRLPR